MNRLQAIEALDTPGSRGGRGVEGSEGATVAMGRGDDGGKREHLAGGTYSLWCCAGGRPGFEVRGTGSRDEQSVRGGGGGVGGYIQGRTD